MDCLRIKKSFNVKLLSEWSEDFNIFIDIFNSQVEISLLETEKALLFKNRLEIYSKLHNFDFIFKEDKIQITLWNLIKYFLFQRFDTLESKWNWKDELWKLFDWDIVEEFKNKNTNELKKLKDVFNSTDLLIKYKILDVIKVRWNVDSVDKMILDFLDFDLTHFLFEEKIETTNKLARITHYSFYSDDEIYLAYFPGNYLQKFHIIEWSLVQQYIDYWCRVIAISKHLRWIVLNFFEVLWIDLSYTKSKNKKRDSFLSSMDEIKSNLSKFTISVDGVAWEPIFAEVNFKDKDLKNFDKLKKFTWEYWWLYKRKSTKDGQILEWKKRYNFKK